MSWEFSWWSSDWTLGFPDMGLISGKLDSFACMADTSQGLRTPLGCVSCSLDFSPKDVWSGYHVHNELEITVFFLWYSKHMIHLDSFLCSVSLLLLFLVCFCSVDVKCLQFFKSQIYTKESCSYLCYFYHTHMHVYIFPKQNVCLYCSLSCFCLHILEISPV